MNNDIYKKAIEYLPMFFEVQLQFDPYGASIFEPFRKIIDFDEAYIFFLNPDSIRLKYIFSKNRTFSEGDIFPVDLDIKRDLFSVKNVILDSNNKLIKLLNLTNSKSFLTSKLIIRDTVYGFVLLCKNEESFYKPEHTDISSAIGSVISYKIKDMELSDIFKIQLQALKDGLVQTKLAYKTIKQQNVRIVEADKIKNDFLANISHELRTPLNAIIGFSEVLSNQLFGELNTKQAEYVKDIHVSGIQLLEMINEILDISKIEANAMTLNRTTFSIQRVVEEVVNMVSPLADKKLIKIETSISDDVEVYADFQKIRQVLYNLLSNAIKFSPENGKIFTAVKISKKAFTLTVKDSGIGIAPKDQQVIFEKFIQLENSYTKRESSTGLGLTITKEIIEMHGGEISVKSSLGKGATFIVKIPLLNPEELAEQERLKILEMELRREERHKELLNSEENQQSLSLNSNL